MVAVNSGLKRIFLIDSFITHRETVINLDQNANISGTNGAGKTTCLRLIPFFYGIEPRQLDNQAAGKKSFVDWYLPRKSSLIIFEYQRESELCSVVVYRHPSGTKPAYRFLKAGFDKNFFCKLNDNNQLIFLSNTELTEKWRQSNLEYSKQIENVSDYRAIIQHDRSLMLNQHKRSSELRTLAIRFSLGGPKIYMRHIEKVTYSILSRQGSMKKIKLMLADIMQEDGLHIPAPPKHNENQQIIDDFSSLSSFKTHLPRFQLILSDYQSVEDINNELSMLHAALLEENIKSDALQKNTNDKLNLAQQEKQAVEERWSETSHKHHKLISQTKSDMDEIQNRISNLKAKHKSFQKDQLDQLAIRLKELPHQEERLARLKNQQSNLIQSVQIEREEYERLKDRELIRHQEQLHEFNQIIAQHHQNRQDEEIQYQKKLREEDKRFFQEKENMKAIMADRKTQLNEDMIRAKMFLDSPMPSSELSTQKEQLGKAIRALESKISDIEQLAQKSQSNLNRKKEERELSHEKLNRAIIELNNKQKELQTTGEWLYPKEQTLLYQLRQLKDSPLKQIAKIMKPELLLDNQLTPELKNTSPLCFGWQLKTDHLPEYELARNTEVIEQKIIHLQQEIEHSKRILEMVQNDTGKIDKECRLIENEYQEHKRNLKNLREQQQSLRDSENLLCDKIKVDIHERIQQAKNSLGHSEKQLEELIEKESRQTTELEDEQLKTQHALNHAIQEKIAEINKKIESIETVKKQEQIDHEQQLTLFNANFSQILTEKGIDTGQFKKIDAEIKELNHLIKDIRKRQPDIESYLNFCEIEWPGLELFEAKLDDSRRKLQNDNLALEQEENLYKSQTKKITNEIKQLTDILSELIENAKITQELTTHLPPPASESQIELPFQSLIARIRELINNKEILSEQIRDEIYFVRDEISRHANSQIAKAWSKLEQDLTERYSLQHSRTKLVAKLPEALKLLIERDIPLLEQTLIETMRVIGNQLSQFYQGLKDVHHRVNLQASQISRSIENYCRIPALQNIQVKMISKIEMLEYWQKLSLFEQAWVKWQDNNHENLPDQILISHFAEVLTTLSQIQITQQISSFFDLELLLEEHGRQVSIRNDHDLVNASSTGLSYLALCAIFMGICRLLCPDKSVALHWPVDELGIIAPENISMLFSMLADAGIIMFGGFPNTNTEMLKHFKHNHLIERQSGIKKIAVTDNGFLDELRQSIQFQKEERV